MGPRNYLRYLLNWDCILLYNKMVHERDKCDLVEWRSSKENSVHPHTLVSHGSCGILAGDDDPCVVV